MVDDPENPHHFVKMDSTLRLNNDKHFGANFQPDEDQVHVLVKMPPRKKQRVDDDELAFWQETLDAISKFGQGLKPETDLAVGALLNTPPKSTGSEYLGVKVHGGLYVRQEYWDIYEILKEKLQREKRIDRVLVIGSPGIGKSVFGVFLLLLFMSEHRNVAYRPLDYGTMLYYFTWNAVENCYEASLRPISGNRYEGLFDGNESVHAQKNYNEFAKQDCVKIYMNPWTKDECQGYVDAVELEDEGEWFNRYNVVGGKPRLLLSVCLTWEYLIAEVKSAIPTEFDQLQNMMRGWGEEMKHILFEMHRDVEDPGRCFFQFASEHIDDMVTNSLKAQSKDRIRALLQT